MYNIAKQMAYIFFIISQYATCENQNLMHLMGNVGKFPFDTNQLPNLSDY